LEDVVEKNKLYDTVITLLLGLYYLYRKSPKMKKGLKISFKSLNRNRVLVYKSFEYLIYYNATGTFNDIINTSTFPSAAILARPSALEFSYEAVSWWFLILKV
jgi:hypothetical protein